MNTIPVSVVIPTYNQTHLLAMAIESVKNQTYDNIEIIIIDDNIEQSVRKQVEIIVSDFNMGNIRYYQNERNLGSVGSRNRGIGLSSGKYITFLDDDDYYEVGKIRRQLELMQKEDSLYSVCNIALHHTNGKIEKRKRNYLRKNEELLIKHLKYHIAATSTFMFETEFLSEIGGFSNLDFGDDYYLMEQAILLSDKFVHADFIGVHAQINADEGLSSWENKIKTEKFLYMHKKEMFNKLSLSDRSYILMRHNLVVSHSLFSGKKFLRGLFSLMKSFSVHPIGFLSIVIEKDK